MFKGDPRNILLSVQSFESLPVYIFNSFWDSFRVKDQQLQRDLEILQLILQLSISKHKQETLSIIFQCDSWLVPIWKSPTINLGRSVTSSQSYQTDNKVETAQGKGELKASILSELLLIMKILSLARTTTTTMDYLRIRKVYFSMAPWILVR